MRALREAILLLLLVFLIIFPLTPGGRYYLYNLKSGYGDLKTVKQYLQARGIVVIEGQITRRNLGTTRNCEAAFRTDVAALQNVTKQQGCPLVDDGPTEVQKRTLKKIAESRQLTVLEDILHVPPHLSNDDKQWLTRSYQSDNLLIFKEDPKTLPDNWAYARLFVVKTDGRAYLYYAR